MSVLPFNGGTGNNVQNATLLAGINPQQLLFGGLGLTNNPTLNGILSTFQTGSLTGFSPDTFNFSGSGNPLFPTGTGGTNTGNIFLGTNFPSTGLPNPLTGTGGTSVPNPLTGTGGTSTPNPLSGTGGSTIPTPDPLTGTGGTSIPNPLTGTGGTSTPNPLNGTPQNLAAIQSQNQNPAFTSNLVIPPSVTGLGGTTGLGGGTGLGGTTNLLGGGSSLIGSLGLGGGTSGSSGGLSQVLTVLVQLLTQLGPTLAAAKPPAAAATPPAEDPEIKKLNDRIDELEAENKKLTKELDDEKDKPPADPPPPKTGGGGNDDDKGDTKPKEPKTWDEAFANEFGGVSGFITAAGNGKDYVTDADVDAFLAKQANGSVKYEIVNNIKKSFGFLDNGGDHMAGLGELTAWYMNGAHEHTFVP